MRKFVCFVAVLAMMSSVFIHSTVFASAEITADKAKEAALSRTGSGVVTECELDYEDGKKIYEIQVIDGSVKHNLVIDAADAQIRRYKSKTYSEYNTDGSQEINAKKAQEIALAKTEGGSVTACKLDFENGRKVYEIDIVQDSWKYEVDVDVLAAEVCSFEKKAVQESQAPSSQDKEITMEQAQEIALAKTGGGTVTECDYDREHGRTVYGIEIVNGNMKYEMDVCTTDSQIYDYEQKQISGTTAGSPEITKGITAKQAQEIALEKTGGGTVVKCKLDFDDGRNVYEIEIKNGNMEYEMSIGVQDSQIYDFEQEQDD